MMPTLNLWSVQGTSLGVAFLRGLICWSDHALDWGLAKGLLAASHALYLTAYSLNALALDNSRMTLPSFYSICFFFLVLGILSAPGTPVSPGYIFFPHPSPIPLPLNPTISTPANLARKEDGDCSHEIKRRLLLGRKVMTNLIAYSKAETLLGQQRFV